MARTLPTYTLEIAWSKAVSGVALFDTATFDGAGVFGGAFGNYTYTTETSRLKEAEITRGAQGGEVAGVRAGTARFALKDLDGRFNPENPSSPLAGSLLPLRPVRFRAVHNSVTSGLFFGFLSRIEHDPAPSVQETVIEAVDFLEFLQASYPTINTIGYGRTVGDAVRLLLDWAGWTDTAFLSLDIGRPLLDFTADGSRSALDLLQDLMTFEQGVFFVDGDGVLTFQDCQSRDEPRSVDATWTQTLIGSARPGIDLAFLQNGQQVTNENTGAVFLRVDETTRDPVTGYGRRDGVPITLPYFPDDFVADNLAAYLVLLHKDPSAPTRQVGIPNRDDTAIVQQLTREIGDRVTLTEPLGGTSTTGTIEGITHRIWQSGKFHTADYTLSKRRFDVAIFGTATFDAAAVVGY